MKEIKVKENKNRMNYKRVNDILWMKECNNYFKME